MAYSELLRQIQKETDEFPIGAAFSDKQFEEMMNKWGFAKDDYSKIVQIGNGVFIRKTDRDAYREMVHRHSVEMETFLSDMTNFEDAVYYEMCNHEYGINWQGTYDVLTALGLNCEYENEFDCLTEQEQAAFLRAKARYNKDAMENEWF